MKRLLFVLGVLALVSLGSCHQNRADNVLISRTFPTMRWERFDYVTRTVTLDKPVTYDLELDVVFDSTYPFEYFSMVFTVFDNAEHPLRAMPYRFSIKDRDGAWKSEPENGSYRFRFPINSELSLNDPGTYMFHIENRMPITPLIGIREISIINK